MLIVADGLHVDGLLPALVAGGTMHTIVDFIRTAAYDGDVTGAWVGWTVVQLDVRFFGIRLYASTTVQQTINNA